MIQSMPDPTRRRVATRATAGSRAFVLAAGLLAGCAPGPSRSADAQTLRALSAVAVVPLDAARALREISAAAVSIAHPGVVFGVNDSGNEPVLFAFDTTGADRGRWRLQGVTNRDWEAVAVGRCAAGDDAWCLFIGDTGDNSLRHDDVRILRVAEPSLLPAGQGGTLAPDVLIARYSDTPHNVEAMHVAPDGSIILMTKEARGSRAAGLRPTLLYRIARPQWRRDPRSEAPLPRAELVDSLPIYPRSAAGRMVTDAALAGDGRLLAVRTYRELYVFAADSATALPRHDLTPVVCDLAPLEEGQGEGVGFLAWQGMVGRFAFTSEGRRESLRLADCPLPDR